MSCYRGKGIYSELRAQRLQQRRRGIFRVAEEHLRVLLVERRVRHAGVARRAHGPLEGDRGLGLRGASRSLDAVRNGSNLDQRPPTSSEDGHESFE